MIQPDKAASKNPSDKLRLSLTDLFKVRKHGSVEQSLHALSKRDSERAHTHRSKLDEIKEKRKKHYPKDFIAINKANQGL